MIVQLLVAGACEGAAIVAFAALAATCSPRSAATRCAIWACALVALLLMPPLTVLFHLPLTGAIAPAAAAPMVAVVVRGAAAARPTLPVIDLIWAAGAMLFLLRLTVSAVQLERIRRRATALGIFDDVYTSDEVTVPFASGVFAPRIVIPRHLATSLGRSELALIVAHERAHIERRDLAINALLNAARVVLYANPWFYVVAAAIVRERERACDDVVVARTNQADLYAQTLAMLAARITTTRSPVVAPSAFRFKHVLVARIERLLERRASPILSINGFAVGGTVITFALLTLALQLLSPTLASGAVAPATPSESAAACKTPDRFAAIVTPVMPSYPDSARKANVGMKTVLVRLTIDARGEITAAEIQQSSGIAAMDQSALLAARQSTYTPAFKHCRAVPSSFIFHADFSPN